MVILARVQNHGMFALRIFSLGWDRSSSIKSMMFYNFVLFLSCIHESECCFIVNNINKGRSPRDPRESNLFCKCEKIVCHTYMTYCVHEDHIAICLITFRIFISEHLIWLLSSICLLFRWGYRGVIIGWDEKARAPQEWSWVVLESFFIINENRNWPITGPGKVESPLDQL